MCGRTIRRIDVTQQLWCVDFDRLPYHVPAHRVKSVLKVQLHKNVTRRQIVLVPVSPIHQGLRPSLHSYPQLARFKQRCATVWHDAIRQALATSLRNVRPTAIGSQTQPPSFLLRRRKVQRQKKNGRTIIGAWPVSHLPTQSSRRCESLYQFTPPTLPLWHVDFIMVAPFILIHIRRLMLSEICATQ